MAQPFGDAAMTLLAVLVQVKSVHPISIRFEEIPGTSYTHNGVFHSGSSRCVIECSESDKLTIMQNLWAVDIDAYDHAGEFGKFYVNVPE